MWIFLINLYNKLATIGFINLNLNILNFLEYGSNYSHNFNSMKQIMTLYDIDLTQSQKND